MSSDKQTEPTRVQVSAPVLSWALSRSRDPQLSKKFPKLSEWLSGEAMPTLRQLEDLAHATATPFGYLLLSEPPAMQLPIPLYRTFDTEVVREPSPGLLETVQTMKRRQDWLREFLIDHGSDALPFVGSATVGDDLRALSVKIRNELGLQEGWAARESSWSSALRQLMHHVESAGIIVVAPAIVGNNTRRRLDPQEFRGFVLVDEYAPLLLVNGADGKAAQMFTLAHEIAHLWFGASAAFDLDEMQPAANEVELACNRVAAELLAPENEVRTAWAVLNGNADRFQQMARQFKVSELVVARRALDLGYISRTEFRAFYRDYMAREREKAPADGGNFYNSQNLRVGRRFVEAVVHAVREDRLLYRDAYQLTGLYGRVFEDYTRALGLGGTT